MNRSCRGLVVAIVVSVLPGCAANPEPEAVASRPLGGDPGITSGCGQSPTGLAYFATEWQRDVLDYDGLIGACSFDASCLPSCWGATSDWVAWSGPLIDCPCGVRH